MVLVDSFIMCYVFKSAYGLLTILMRLLATVWRGPDAQNEAPEAPSGGQRAHETRWQRQHPQTGLH